MGNGLSSAVNAIRDVPTRKSIQTLGIELRRVDRSVTTLLRNNELVTSFAVDSINLTAGNGLLGGGDLTADRSFAVGGGFGITVTADAVAVDQAMVPTWTGVHTYSAQDVHNAGVSLGTSGVLASAEVDSGGQAGFSLNLTATRSTDDVFDLKSTADAVRFAQCSAKGEWFFGRLDSAAAAYQAGQVLGFVMTSNTTPTLTGGIISSITHDNSGVSPVTMRCFRAAETVGATSGTGDWSLFEGIGSCSQDSASFSAREYSIFRGTFGTGTGTSALGGIVDNYSTGTTIRGDWKRMTTFRSVYYKGNSNTNRPAISSGACLDIPGYSALAASGGQQIGLEVLASSGTPSSANLTSAAISIAFPARGTNKAHLAFIATAAAAGGPTWAPSTISGSSITTGQGGWYVDTGASNPNGPAFHDGTAWRYVLHPTANANGAAGAAQYGSITGLWQFDHMQQVTFDDAKNIVVNATTGTKIGTATTQKLGFWNVAPVVQPGPFTQTYSTATHTHANPTAVTLTDNSGGTANATVQALTDPADTPASADALRDDLVANLIPELRNNFADLAAQINALVADVANVKQFANAIVDDGQLSGIWA